MTTKETAAKIREVLKEKGYSSRKISVKSEFLGYDSAIRVMVKDENIDIEEIRKWLKTYESIDRDERTGEILEGGNTYIHVERI